MLSWDTTTLHAAFCAQVLLVLHQIWFPQIRENCDHFWNIRPASLPHNYKDKGRNQQTARSHRSSYKNLSNRKIFAESSVWSVVSHFYDRSILRLLEEGREGVSNIKYFHFPISAVNIQYSTVNEWCRLCFIFRFRHFEEGWKRIKLMLVGLVEWWWLGFPWVSGDMMSQMLTNWELSPVQESTNK